MKRGVALTSWAVSFLTSFTVNIRLAKGIVVQRHPALEQRKGFVQRLLEMEITVE